MLNRVGGVVSPLVAETNGSTSAALHKACAPIFPQSFIGPFSRRPERDGSALLVWSITTQTSLDARVMPRMREFPRSCGSGRGRSQS